MLGLSALRRLASSLLTAVGVGVFAFFWVTGIWAASGDAVTRQALELVYAGRCEEALPVLEQARSVEDSPHLALVEAQCRLRLRDFDGALAALDDAQKVDPELENLSLYRGIALYQLEDYDEARAALAAAEGHTQPKLIAQLDLYRGMLLLQAQENRQAAELLDRARERDARQVEPVASFYAGLAWQAAGDRNRAREALERVETLDPDGSWGTRAAILLSEEVFGERSWATIRAGLEYDTNVVLLGEDVPDPLGISDQADGRAAWFLDAGLELFRKGRFAGGLGISYAGNVQFELRQFDIQYPRAGAWLDYELGPRTLLRTRYGVGYAWVDYSPFLLTQDASMSLFHGWERWGRTEIGLRWMNNDYKFFIAPVPNGQQTQGAGQPCEAGGGPQPPVPCAPYEVPWSSEEPFNSQAARNRDGDSIRPFVLQRYRFQKFNSAGFHDFEVRGGYAFERYWADGTDWDYSSHDLLIGAEAMLFWDLIVDALVSFSYRPYTFPSSYPAPPTVNGQVYALSPDNRLDKIATVFLMVERAFGEHWSVLTRYSYTRADSNVAVFNYSRNIVGAYVKYDF
ncbi:MAG: hypothetical protein CBC48_08525 [bacterium TMED88]|nr:hypothetical protein [Deltaproteobacteria bacterium]OUV32254.1 MAG: hypothetical protein CBC48_08525 [bacterium TMED88]